MKRICGIAVVAAAAVLAGCSESQNQNGQAGAMAGAQYENGQSEGIPDKAPASPSSNADRTFVNAAANGGAYEVQASRLALQKSTDPTVRNIAQHMADDHAKANATLISIARTRSIHASSAPSLDQQAMLNKLNGLSGSEFDREFVRQQRQAHRDTIALFETEASSGTDSMIRNFASETLPTLHQHLDMINEHATAYGMEQ